MSGRKEIDKKFKQRTEGRLNELPDCIKQYYYSKSKLNIRTKNAYINHICKTLQDINKHILDITKEDLDKYFYNLEYEDGLSNSTIATRYSALMSLYTYLYENKYISKNFMENRERIKVQQHTDGRTDYLTEKELYQYLFNLENDITTSKYRDINKGEHERNSAIIMLFLYTGMRCSALCELSIDDINFENKTILVVTKGKNFQRFHVNQWFDKYLEPWLDVREDFNPNTNALFVSSQGKRLTVQSISNIVSKYTCGIKKHITPHKLRATFATSLYDKGVDMLTISKCLGHKNVNTTSIYIRGFRDDSKIGADVMDKIIGK